MPENPIPPTEQGGIPTNAHGPSSLMNGRPMGPHASKRLNNGIVSAGILPGLPS
jgi:hypothetical protein